MDAVSIGALASLGGMLLTAAGWLIRDRMRVEQDMADLRARVLALERRTEAPGGGQR